MQKIALPLVCLLIGGMGGYALHSVTASGSATAAKDTTTQNQDTRKSSSTGQGGMAASTSSADGSGSLSVAEKIKDLLIDFDIKSSFKAASKLSMSDLQAALAQTAAMPKGSDRDQLRMQLYRAWAAKDPQAAWQAAMADPQSKDNGYLLGAVAGELAKTNPSAAIELAQKLGMGERRTTVMRSVFTEWSTVDVMAAINYSNAHPEQPVDGFSFTRGLSLLADKDPAKAANAALSVKDMMIRNAALGTLMSTWAGKSPTDAMNWAQSLTNPSMRKDAIAAAIGAWAKTDPKAAMAHAQTIPDLDTRANAVKKGWSDWFRFDPVAATGYLAASGDEKLLKDLGYSFGYMTESFSPQERATLLAQIPEGKEKENILRGITSNLIRKGQYNQALEMLNSMPDSTQRDSNVAKLGEEWATADLNAAGAWLKLQPDSTDRDLATAGYASALARTDPTGALQWVNSIPDKTLRTSAMRNIAIRWLKTDPPKAEAWLSGVKDFSKSDMSMIRMMANMAGDYVSTSVRVGDRR